MRVHYRFVAVSVRVRLMAITGEVVLVPVVLVMRVFVRVVERLMRMRVLVMFGEM